MKRAFPILFVLALACTPTLSQEPTSARQALVARAKALELNTSYVPPPGDALEHHTSGFAKIMCSAVFITGLDPDFAAENVGYFTAPYAERAKVGKPVIDRANRAVHIALPGGITRTAKFLGSQGCVTLPVDKTMVNFMPVAVKSQLPDASTEQWPMGDTLPNDPLPAEIDAAKVKHAVDAAFEPASGMTAAFVATWKGRIIGERYGDGITARTPLERGSPRLFQNGKMREIRAPRFELPIFYTCRVGFVSGHHLIPTMTPQVLIPTICIYTQAASTPFTTLPRVRSSGLRTQSDDIATQIRY